MKKRLLVVILIFCFSGYMGCATFSTTHTPNLAIKKTEPIVEPPPVIMTVYELQRFADGNICAPGNITGRVAEEGFNKIFVAASAKSPIMRKASEAPTENVNYVLFLDVVNNERGMKWAKLSGYTLLIIPGVSYADTVVRGTLYDASTGQQIATIEASTETTVIFWLGLLPVAPIIMIVNKVTSKGEPITQCFSDVFIQLSEAIRNRPVPAAIPASRIKIEENPDKGRRSVKVSG